MSTSNTSRLTPLPAAATLLKTTASAALAATVILFATILPAEYGIDPLGTGRMLGLTALSAPPAGVETAPADAMAALSPVQNGPIGQYNAEFNVDTRQIVVDPYQYVEYKYRLEKGASMVYSWSANLTPVYDFHADPDGTPAPDPVSFDKQPKQRASGAFVAPFSGVHGWFWENPGGETLTITLTTAGFYSAATEFRSPRRREAQRLISLDRLSVLRTPAPTSVP
jgi:hypothetical protein